MTSTMSASVLLLGVVLCHTFIYTLAQEQDRRPVIQPTPDESDCICSALATVCKCTFVVEHRLTMTYQAPPTRDSPRPPTILIKPENGQLKTAGSQGGDRFLNASEAARVITADGEVSRLVIAINGKFPGPMIDVFENQMLELTVINRFHTDSVSVHFHGLHQVGTPWMDGVAFLTQCPILPGQTFVYRFKAYPPGTSFYHAHIGDQRTMGLYGPLTVRKRDIDTQEAKFGEIIVALQDWNHIMDAETAYYRMISQQFDLSQERYGDIIKTTYSVDNGQFSRFQFQSGLVNGKGRYWKDANSHNGAPLERFKVATGESYRFRIIGAMTLYPMRVYIEGQTLSLRSSDCYNLDPIAVDSIIIHPGERYDFNFLFGSVTKKEYLLIAETIEVSGSHSGYHAAEAVIEITNYEGVISPNPVNTRIEACTLASRCKVFNCPYSNTGTDIRSCTNFNDVTNRELGRAPADVSQVDSEYFFNFAFPGPPSNTPGSVNGREFVFPVTSLLTQPDSLTTGCRDTDCNDDICNCTYIVDFPLNKVVQLTFTNIGTGSGWSHPVHLHGHTFYVMKMGFGTYEESGALLNATTDIECTDANNYCTDIGWTNSSWAGGNLPGINGDPPRKDTIVVPTGGYVVVRTITNNPGLWFLHCHIDLHNTNGMAMIVNSGRDSHPTPPPRFPTCGNFMYSADAQSVSRATSWSIPAATFLFCQCVTIVMTWWRSGSF